MQELTAGLFWRSFEVDQEADRLRRTLPGFPEAERAYHALADQLRSAAGGGLYGQYLEQLMRYSDYEVYAYYALGLGLRTELIRALGL